MLWVYGQYKCFNSFSARNDFIRQILTHEVGPRTERVNISTLIEKATEAGSMCMSWSNATHTHDIVTD